jgi:hypothetical protein
VARLGAEKDNLVKSSLACAQNLAIIGAALLLGHAAGCQNSTVTPPQPIAAVSSVYSDFKPEEEFERLGFLVEPEGEGGHLNTVEQSGWRPIQGSVTLPPGTSGCENVLIAIRQMLRTAAGRDWVDDSDLDRAHERGRPCYGLIRYTKDGKRGFVYVWLFPNWSETRIYYAILLREEASCRDFRAAISWCDISSEGNQ